MAERAHPEDSAFRGTIYEDKLRERYGRCAPYVRNKRVLDVPCGTGWGGSLLTGYSVLVGLDSDVGSVQFGNENFPPAAFVAGSMATLPFASNAFDVIVCLEGLEHIFRSEAELFISEAWRILSSGGTIIVTVPLLHNGKHSGNPYHLFEYTTLAVDRLLLQYFETVEVRTIHGPDGHEIWFAGKRRASVAKHNDSLGDDISAEALLSRSVRWLDSVRTSGGFSFAPETPQTLIGTCLGILLLESTGQLADIDDLERARWEHTISSSQQSVTGLFRDPLLASNPPGVSHDTTYLEWQTTYFAVHALDVLGVRPRHPLSFLLPYAEPNAVEAWLDGLDWSNPWLESNRIMFLLSAVIHRVEREGKDEAHVLHRVLDWLDRNQDASTGLWGTRKGAGALNALAGAYHFIPFYEYVHRPVQSIPRIIDSALDLQNADGLFGPSAKGGACEDLDAVDVLATLTKYTAYRRRDVRKALVRAYWAVWNLQNEDGSFPYTGRDTGEAYKFSSWQPLTAGLRSGDVWSTWFRGVLLATVASTFPGDVPVCNWRFRRWPALGFHRAGNTLDSNERGVLPCWLRTGAARLAEEEPTVTVVITCYNLGEYLHEAIKSVLAQTFNPIQIIVVDDGSTAEFTRFLLDHFPYEGITLVRQENKGLPAARNAGIRLATAPYICCLDADDRLRPDYLQKAVRLLDTTPGVGFVSCYYEMFDCAHDVYRYSHCRFPEMLVRNEAVVASVFRKQAWHDVGGYCEDLTGMQDWDFWIGILERGYEGAVLPEVLFDYRVRSGSMYSVTTYPSNYTRITRRIVERHLSSYTEHIIETLALKARQFIETVNLRQQDSASVQRVSSAQQNEIGTLRSMNDDLRAAYAAQEEAKQWLVGQIDNWTRVAEDRLHESSKTAAELHEQKGRSEDLQKQCMAQRAELEEQKRHWEVLNQQIASSAAENARASEAIQDRIRELTAEVGRLNDVVAALRLSNRPQPSKIRRLAANALFLVSRLRCAATLKNLTLWLKLNRDPRRFEIWERHFDGCLYVELNPDISRSGVSPALHYLLCGHAERRTASPSFDAAFYLRRHPDVDAAGVNPLLHYALFGEQEHRTAVKPTVPAPPPQRHVPVNGAGIKPAEVEHSLRRFEQQKAEQPLISVIIPCFNYGKYLEEAIASVQAQTFGNWELIVVEGGSTDGVTPGMVREIEKRADAKTRFFYRSEPHLVGDNRNFGIRHALGKYICCLDADDVLRPMYLEIAVFLAETYGFDLVYPSVECFGESTMRWMLSDATFAEITQWNQVSTVALFRKSAWEEAGGYRDWGKGDDYVAEDWDFWIRLLGCGFRAKSISEPLMRYRVHNAGLWYPNQNSTERQRNVLVRANASLLEAGPHQRTPGAAKGWGAICDADSKPSVLLALPFLAIGGAERVFEAITAALLAKGYRVIIITTLVLPETIKDNSRHFESLTPHVYALPHLMSEQEHLWPDFLSFLLTRYEVELIFIAGCDFVYNLLPELRREFPHVGIVDQLFNDQVHFSTNRHYAEYIDVTVVPSQEFADRITCEFGDGVDRVCVIPHGVDVPPLADQQDVAAARTRTALPHAFEKKFLVGFFGRWSAEKAPADFVEVARLFANDPGLAFIMTGEGPERERVLKLIAKYRLADRIHAPGFVENHRDLMLACDVIVVPSRLDGMPLIVMEAQALGKAVVASRVGSIPAMIEHGVTGFLCEPGNTKQFSQMVQLLRNEPDRRDQLVRAARTFVETNHGADRMIEQYLQTFEMAQRSSCALSVPDVAR
jgi:glycosyltransferase involved in cell wall biosynthesis/SAM-dependent methyltransferase